VVWAIVLAHRGLGVRRSAMESAGNVTSLRIVVISVECMGVDRHVNVLSMFPWSQRPMVCESWGGDIKGGGMNCNKGYAKWPASRDGSV